MTINACKGGNMLLIFKKKTFSFVSYILEQR